MKEWYRGVRVFLTRSRLQLFEREAYAASALNHPSILTIYEIAELDESALHLN